MPRTDSKDNNANDKNNDSSASFDGLRSKHKDS